MNKISFPTTFIYEFNINTDLVDQALENILKQELKIVSSTREKPNTSKAIYSKSTSIYHKRLFEEIQKCVDTVCNLHFKSAKLAICDSWLTKSTFGEYSDLHYHSSSIFSGLLYFTDHEKSETIFKIKDPFFEKYSMLFADIVMPQNYELQSQPKKGKLIIWDSSITHKISVHRDKKTRYTLSFNTWLTGNIGTSLSGRLTSHVVDVSQEHDN